MSTSTLPFDEPFFDNTISESSLLTLHLIHPDTAFVGGRLEDAVDAGDVYLLLPVVPCMTGSVLGS